MSRHPLLALSFLLIPIALLSACVMKEEDDDDDEEEFIGVQLEARLACGGFAGLACPDGYVCVDDRSDSCDPNNGGADCIGVCKADQLKECRDTRHKTYIADAETCASIRFTCDQGTAFFDDCGCGCTTR